MTATKSISVALDKKHQTILQKQIESGRHDSISAVVADALTPMTERDEVFDEWLRQEVRMSIADDRPLDPSMRFSSASAHASHERQKPRVVRDVVFLRRAEERLAELGLSYRA